MACLTLLVLLGTVFSMAMAAIPPNYNRIDGHGLYKLSADKKAWTDAQLQCENEQASLAVINSPDESKALKKLLRDAHVIKAHIGFEDRDGDGNFRTILQGDLSEAGFNVWKKEPSRDGHSMCGMMWSCGRLGETTCDARQNYICELLNEPEAVK